MASTQSAPSSRSIAALDALLVEARADSAEFPEVLANHLPMILVALDRMGASEQQLRAFFAHYRMSNGLVPAPAHVSAVTSETWRQHLGDRTRESDYRVFFGREVARLGIRDAVGAYLPALAPGIAGSALHPLMRLAYGIMRADPAEVGTALGYWATGFLPLPPAVGTPPVTDDPGEVLARVAAIPGLRNLPVYDHLWYAMRATAADPGFAPAVDWLRIDAATPRRVAETALGLFAATMDFSALHALTGSHWVRIVSTVCSDPLVLRHFWQAVGALVPSIGFPTLPTAADLDAIRHRPCPDWHTIVTAAVARTDEHDISLVFSAREEEQIYGDRLYRVVAARRLGLIA